MRHRLLHSAQALFVAGALLPGLAAAQTLTGNLPSPPKPSTTDPRVGLRAGWKDAGTASMHIEHVGHVDRQGGFVDENNVGDFGRMNSDLAFQGNTLFMGNFHGVQIYDISNPTRPRLRTSIECPGGQGDVSVHGNLLFMSVEETRGRVDCGPQGIQERVSAERFRGVRIFDIRNLDAPRQVGMVQTCRGSHTHTLVPDKNDPANLYVYVSGTSGVRPAEELAGCSGQQDDPNNSYFRIEVIKVPMNAPQRAAIVNSSRFLLGLAPPPEHGPAESDVAASAQRAAAARAQGKFTVAIQGEEQVVPDQFAQQQLAQIVTQRGGTGAPTRADSVALRAALPGIVAQMFGGTNRTGPNQCHDITVYPEINRAGGACAGYGILLDISNPADPKRINEVSDANFAYWHSATFNNDGSKILFSDEWGGGTAPRCRATDRPEWGANAIFTLEGNTMRPASYYKLPAAQTTEENCVAHNGSLIPVPGRDIMAQAWYQGGLSIFDFTNAANPVEIAYFDRGPVDGSEMAMGGFWSVYWYNGYLYGSEIARGLDVFKLVPSNHLSAGEIAAAEAVQDRTVNPQTQTMIKWAHTPKTARAYLDQLERVRALAPAHIARLRADLNAAERGNAAARARLMASASGVAAVAAHSPQQARLEMLAATLRGMRR